MKLIGERIFNVNQFLDVFYRMTKSYQMRKVCEDVVNEFTEAVSTMGSFSEQNITTGFLLQIIQTRRKELEKERRLAPEQDEFHSKLLIFLDQVLTIRKGEDKIGFTDREILDHLLTIMGAVCISESCQWRSGRSFQNFRAKILQPTQLPIPYCSWQCTRRFKTKL